MIWTWIIVFVASFYATIRLSNLVISQALKYSHLHKISLLTTGFFFGAVFTSLPELIISTISAVMKANEIALGNVLGGNITEILLISSVVFISSKHFSISNQRMEKIKKALLFSILLSILILSVNKLDWIIGSVLVLLYTFFVFFHLYGKKLPPFRKKETKNIFKFSFSMITLIIASLFLIISVREIALETRISEIFFGAIIISIGTSLPNLILVVNAMREGSPSLAIGSVIGDCIFNLAFSLGTSAIINPIAIFTPLVSFLVGFFILGSVFVIYSLEHLKNYEAAFFLITSYALYIFFFYFLFSVLK